MAKNWKFGKFHPQSFGGINEATSFVIVLDRPEQIVELSGEQGVNKTSTLECLKYILGGAMPANAINSVDGTAKGELEIMLDDGRKLDVSFTKDKFTLYLTQDDIRSKVDAPRTFISKLIGPLGVSPMFLKTKDGAAQVAWLREIAKLTPDQVKMEAEIKSKSEADFKSRTNVNRDVKQMKIELDKSPYFNWDKENSVFVANAQYKNLMASIEKGAVDAEAINKRFQDATQETNTLAVYKSTLESVREQKVQKEALITRKQSQIAQLEKELLEEQQAFDKIVERETIGAAKIKELDGAEDRAKYAQEQMMGLNALLEQKKTAENDNWKSNTYAKKAEDSEALSARLLDWAVKQKQFIQAITPDVEGIEVRVKRTIDPQEEEDIYKAINPDATPAQVKAHIASLESGNEEGLFYNGRSVNQLCESELWDLCLVLWHHMGVNVIFIENFNTLGTDAVERINWFAEKGLVFFSQMERGQKDLNITFHTKIPTISRMAEAYNNVP